MPRPPTRPLIVILILKKEYHIYLIHPSNGKNFLGIFKGINQAFGYLKDSGYEISKLKNKIPKWVSDKIFGSYIIHGVCEIHSFPLVKNES